MMRREFISEGGSYRTECLHYEDYDLFLRNSEKFSYSNITNPLLYYRLHTSNVSVTNKNTQIKGADEISTQYISKLIQSKVDFSLVQMIKFNSNDYHCWNAALLLRQMFSAFKENNLIFEPLEKEIQHHICTITIGLVRRDKSWLRKLNCFLYVFFLFPVPMTKEIILRLKRSKAR